MRNGMRNEMRIRIRNGMRMRNGMRIRIEWK